MPIPEILAWICLSNAPFRWVKRVFFHRWMLWPICVCLAIGLPLAVFGKDHVASTGLGLALPFLFWVFSLGLVSGVLSIPRFVMLAVSLTALCSPQFRLSVRIANWATKYEPLVNATTPPCSVVPSDLVDTTMAEGNHDGENR